MDNLIESRPAVMKFSDAHNILTDIGYNFARQSGSSHKVYTKPNSKNIVLSPHGKDLSPASTREVHTAIKVHKMRKVAEAVLEGDLILAKELFEDIIKEKVLEKLQEKRIEIFEGDVKVFNKKQKKRMIRHLGSIARKEGDPVRSITTAGRKMISTTPPEKLRSILATEGFVKNTNKKMKREVERRIGRNLEKNHGGGGGLTGRLVMKLMPSETTKALSKKQKPEHWTNNIGFYGHRPVTESNGKFKYNLNVIQPQTAFKKNIKHRENLEKKLDVLSKKGINK